MPAPSQLSIATQSVQRLVKEETYYHKELASQKARIEKLEADIQEGSNELDDNAEFVLRQEQQAMDETKAVFGPLRKRITDAVQKLEEQIAISESDEGAPEAELTKAKEALQQGQDAVKDEA